MSAELRRIVKVARDGWWVDMESKLRTDDWFDTRKAEECVAQFQAHVSGRALVPAVIDLEELLPDPTSEEMRLLCAREKAAVGGDDGFDAGWYQAFAWLQGQIYKSGD